jgi:hypothetical protein
MEPTAHATAAMAEWTMNASTGSRGREGIQLLCAAV